MTGKLLWTLNFLVLLFIFTPLSFTGFYTDIAALLSVMVLTAKFIFNREYSKSIRIPLIMILLFEIIFLSGLWIRGDLKVENVTKFTIENNSSWAYKNAYFNYKAVGCGMGEYWEAVTFRYFPILEYRTLIDRCSHFIIEE